MASILLGSSSLVWMPGEKVQVAKNGLVTITSPFGCRFAGGVSLIPAPGSEHRNYTGTYCESYEFTREEGDLMIGIVTYSGITFQFDSLPAPIYSLLQSLTNEPIDSHPKFIERIGGTSKNRLHGAVFDDQTGIFKSFKPWSDMAMTVPNPKAGNSEYLNATMVWRKNWMSRVKPSSVASSGKIGTPEGPAPALKPGANWLVGPYTVVDRGLGQIYEITLDWLASSMNGWDPDVYGP